MALSRHVRTIIAALFVAVAACSGALAQEVLSPLPIQHFVDNNGNALTGGKLFTYQAGTTTPATTYTSSTGGTPNTNPVILNTRGEANVWIPAGTAFKFVLSPSTDTNPPTNPIWTVDNITTANASIIGALIAGDCIKAANTTTGLADAGAPCNANAPVATIAALQALPNTTPVSTIVSVQGYYVAYDGGGGPWQYSSASCAVAWCVTNTAGGSWTFIGQSPLDLRQLGMVGGSTATDPNSNNATLFNTMQSYCATLTSGGHPVGSINISGGGETYGLNAPAKVTCNGIVIQHFTFKALSAGSILCTTDALFEVNNGAFITTIQDIALDSNFLAVNGMSISVNGAEHYTNINVSRWQGSCANATVTGASAVNNGYTVTMASTTGLSTGMVSRGNSNISDRSVIVGITANTSITLSKPVTGTITSSSLTFYNDSNGVVCGINNSNCGGNYNNFNVTEYQSSDTTACGGGNCLTLNAYRYGFSFDCTGDCNDISLTNSVIGVGVAPIFMDGGASGLQINKVEINAGGFATSEPSVPAILTAQGWSNFQLINSGVGGGAIMLYTLDATALAFTIQNTRFVGSANANLDVANCWAELWTNQSLVNLAIAQMAPNSQISGSIPYWCTSGPGSYNFGNGQTYSYLASQMSGQVMTRFAMTNLSTKTPTGTTDGSTAVITAISSFTGLSIGCGITATGIPSNSYIVALNPVLSTLTISGNTTSANTAETLTVTCGNYAFQPGDSGKIFDYENGAGNYTPFVMQTLPNGWWAYLYIKGSGTISITPTGSATVNGSGSADVLSGAGTLYILAVSSNQAGIAANLAVK